VTTHIDILIGRIALERGLISRDQLADCLSEQKAAHGSPLGSIMLQKGLIKPRDLEGLLEEQKQRLADALDLSDPKLEDALLGRMLIKQGLAKEAQIYECLRHQAEMGEAGHKAPRLGELLVRKGYLSTDAFDTAMVAQAKEVFVCPSCASRFSTMGTDAARKYTCKKCGCVLERQEHLGAPGETTGAVRIDVPDDAAAVAKDPARQLSAGKYILIREVGRGGMGVVWKAWQTDLKRYVAVKILAGTQWTDVELKRFYREAQMAAALSHTNIASIFEVGADEGKHYIVMEFVDGETLGQMMSPPGKTSTGRGLKHLSPRRAAEIVRDAALAVDYAHSKKIIHRDLKPLNIMVQKSDNRVYVMDFGLAKPIRDQSLTVSDLIVGTPSYMSPEQARGDALDRRTDVYSMGAVLYHALTGHAPFERKSVAETILGVMADDPPLPRKLNPRLHPDLETISLKCLDKDRHRRYDSARSLADDLSRFLEGEPISARPLSWRESAWKSIRRRPVYAVLGAACLLAVFLFGAAQFGMSFQAGRRVTALKEQASDAFRREAYQEALSFYAQVLELDPDDPDAQVAKKFCEDFIQGRMGQRQADGKAFRESADEYFRQEDWDLAARFYDRAVYLDPTDKEARERLARCEQEIRGRRQERLDLEKQAAKLKEEILAERRKTENQSKAYPDYEKAHRAAVTAVRMRLLTGGGGYTISQVRDKYQEARELLNRAIIADSTYSPAFYFRGTIRHRMGDYALAQQDFRRAHELNPDGPAAFGLAMTNLTLFVLNTHAPFVNGLEATKAAAAQALEEMGEAVDGFRKSDSNFERFSARALDDLRNGRYTQGIDNLGKVAGEREALASFAFHFIQAVIWLTDRKETEALKELASALELEPSAYEALFLQAIVKAARSDFVGALPDAKKALEAAPEDFRAYLLLAHVREGLGEPGTDVGDDLRRAAELGPLPLRGEILRIASKK
jgi:tetratricopeptide (TPR) repeat protein/tRNA A-37 threonylcarbamoyl transferase component Bud32